MAVAAILDHVGFAGAATRRLTQRRAAGVLLPVLGCVVLEAPAIFLWSFPLTRFQRSGTGAGFLFCAHFGYHINF